ncbi:unnamed protein product [Arabidopsis lyrata]|uniref:Predicted protein n=1 Tax=Arabidopsis lyrata subsp. lyrata TaxID=81972 RepID=D7LRR9_ARALL|nr:predicted protein [Arabidopsis lyrata subsp. lyrata]CAH8269292.1 unnamed protein product [Arabidopsis lyrata]
MAASPTFLHEKPLSKQTLDDLDGAFCNFFRGRHVITLPSSQKTCHVIYSFKAFRSSTFCYGIGHSPSITLRNCGNAESHLL